VTKIIKNLIYSLIPAEHHWKFTLFKQWDDIIGNLKDRVVIEKIEGDTLILTTTHPAWANELLLLTPLLKQKINACFDKPRIKTIRLKTAMRKPAAPQRQIRNRSTDTTQQKLPPSILTPQEKTILAHLSDKTLQLVIADYLVRCKDLKRSKDELDVSKKGPT